jgi:hypothetical protein
MDLIKAKTAEAVQQAYKDLGVKESRVKAALDKFATIPDKFTCHGLIVVDIKVGENINKNIPALAISEDGTKYVLVGQMISQFTDKTAASVITKEGDNNGKFLVVNNKRVHSIFEGMSEAEVVAFCIGKTFVSKPAKDFKCYQPKYVDNKPVFADTAEQALADVKPKSYRVVNVA